MNEETKRIALYNAEQCERFCSYLIFQCKEKEAEILAKTAKKVREKYCQGGSAATATVL